MSLLSFGDYRIWAGYQSKTVGIAMRISRKTVEFWANGYGAGGITSLATRSAGGPMGQLNWSGHFPDS